MFGAINKFIRKIRSSGLRNALEYSCFSLFGRHAFVIFRVDLGEHSLPENLLDGFTVVTDLARLREMREGRNLDQDFYRDEIDGCSRPFLVVGDGDIVAIGWVYDENDKSRIFKLKKSEVELNYLHTIDKYRGKRIHGQLIYYVLRHCQIENAKYCYMAIHSENVNALNSVRRQPVWDELGELVQYGIFRPKFNQQ